MVKALCYKPEGRGLCLMMVQTDRNMWQRQNKTIVNK
jgi:hypothetical protein